MNGKLIEIKELINAGDTKIAIERLNELVKTEMEDKDFAYYLLGNAYRKENDWQGAMNNYQEAIDLNPESPAKEARAMMLDIMNFYNKDMYNQ